MGVPAAPVDLHAHEAVIYDQRTGGTEWTFQRGSAEVGVTVSGRMRITAAEGVRAAVLADAGLTVASEWMFAPELKSGAVCPGDRVGAAPNVALGDLPREPAARRESESVRGVHRE
jgi:DNA-binding transcriptional LysR family regulator